MTQEATKCFRCGGLVPPNTRYCGHCGALVADPHESTLVVEGVAPETEMERVSMVLAGEYEVVREIARGGMGVIYEARDVGLSRQVALKVLAPSLALAARSAERFKREGRTVAGLEHPNIVPVYRVGERGGVLFIAMKFVEGRALDEIIKEQGAFGIPLTLHVLRAATRALAYAHERGIVHRDVKGANLLVDRDGRVMVTDFGVALRSSDVTLTQDGSMIGTPAFMSPEQCAGKRAGPQSDQYSLGIVAFQMLAGAVPFDSDTLPGFIKHHLYSPLPDLRLARDDVPQALLDMVNRSLSKDPDERFPNTRDMLAAIEALPFSEQDRRDSEEQLRKLSVGTTVNRVHTRSLPAMPDLPTMLLAGAPRRRPLLARSAVWGSALVVIAVAGTWLTLNGGVGTPRQADDTSTVALATDTAGPAADSAPPKAADVAPQPPPAPGTLRALTSPANAEILVDGSVVDVGSAFDRPLAAGPRRIQVRAPGYVTFDTTVTVPPGGLINLGRIALRPR